jgi:uncharacterized membrane protein YraQ (UPF0718 family)
MYADIFGNIPNAVAFVYKGAQLGVNLSFYAGVTTLSLPSMISCARLLTKAAGTVHCYLT